MAIATRKEVNQARHSNPIFLLHPQVERSSRRWTLRAAYRCGLCRASVTRDPALRGSTFLRVCVSICSSLWYYRKLLASFAKFGNDTDNPDQEIDRDMLEENKIMI